MDLPQPPQDNDLKTIIDKLAQFVARNGPEFEAVTKSKQKGNPKFSFLFGGEHYNYYMYRVNAEQAILRHKAQQQMQTGFQQPQGDWPQQHTYGGGWAGSGQHMPPGQPRPLMDLQPFGGAPQQATPPARTPLPDVSKLKSQLESLTTQVATLQEQISQSESNLKAQREVTDSQVKAAVGEAIQKAKREHLELLAGDTGLSLEEMNSVMQPIIEGCTKDSISVGKSWIFNKAISHDNNQLISHYLAFRVTDDEAPFSLKLHLIYLMNDVLHHCVRKSNEELKLSFEAVAVEMFCAAWVTSSQDSERGKLSKLIRLWEDKNIFTATTLNKMRSAHESWSAYNQQLKHDYAQAIQLQTQNYIDTYNSYEKQHEAFVNHAHNTINSLKAQIKISEDRISEAEEEIQKRQKQDEQIQSLQRDGESWQQSENFPEDAQPRERQSRSSRWDSGADGNSMGWNEQNLPPPGFIAPGPAVFPDLSRPPPGFLGPPPSFGGPPGGPGIMGPVSYDEKQLIPTLPYYDLPAGLIVPLVPLEENGYKPLDPKKIRLPPPTPPTPALLAALEQFYAPPSHDRPRDPDGWEMLGLYEWCKSKSAAIKAKADAIDSGKRERSPTASPDPYYSGGSTPEPKRQDTVPQKTSTFVEEVPNSEDRRKRYVSRSRSRSRTRSRSRESTPDYGSRRRSRSRSRTPPGRRRNRSDSRSPSPSGSYTPPSYSRSRRSPVVRRDRSQTPPRRFQRSPSPDSPGGVGFVGFGGMQKLDSSNKGHQLLQKMGWKGSGLGSEESGIVEPISGGEIRDKSELYRGIGAATSNSDPFEAYRKARAGSFYTRMRERDKERDKHRGSKK